MQWLDLQDAHRGTRRVPAHRQEGSRDVDSEAQRSNTGCSISRLGYLPKRKALECLDTTNTGRRVSPPVNGTPFSNRRNTTGWTSRSSACGLITTGRCGLIRWKLPDGTSPVGVLWMGTTHRRNHG